MAWRVGRGMPKQSKLDTKGLIRQAAYQRFSTERFTEILLVTESVSFMKEGIWPVALGLVQDLLRRSPEAGSLSQVVKEFNKCTQWEATLHTMDAFQQCGRPLPHELVNVKLSAFAMIRKGLLATGRNLSQIWVSALDCLRRAEMEGFEPDTESWRWLSSSASRTSAWQVAVALAGKGYRAREKGEAAREQRLAMYISLIESCALEGKVDLALAWTQEVLANYSNPKHLTPALLALALGVLHEGRLKFEEFQDLAVEMMAAVASLSTLLQARSDQWEALRLEVLAELLKMRSVTIRCAEYLGHTRTLPTLLRGVEGFLQSKETLHQGYPSDGVAEEAHQLLERHDCLRSSTAMAFRRSASWKHPCSSTLPRSGRPFDPPEPPKFFAPFGLLAECVRDGPGPHIAGEVLGEHGLLAMSSSAWIAGSRGCLRRNCGGRELKFERVMPHVHTHSVAISYNLLIPVPAGLDVVSFETDRLCWKVPVLQGPIRRARVRECKTRTFGTQDLSEASPRKARRKSSYRLPVLLALYNIYRMARRRFFGLIMGPVLPRLGGFITCDMPSSAVCTQVLVFDEELPDDSWTLRQPVSFRMLVDKNGPQAIDVGWEDFLPKEIELTKHTHLPRAAETSRKREPTGGMGSTGPSAYQLRGSRKL